MLDAVPPTPAMLADRGYDADWFRDALRERSIEPSIPSCKKRKVAIAHDAILYKKRHRIEYMFGRVKDWRCVATRYDRCAEGHRGCKSIAERG